MNANNSSPNLKSCHHRILLRCRGDARRGSRIRLEEEQRLPALCTQCTKRLGWAIRCLPTNTRAWCVEDVLSPAVIARQSEEFMGAT